MEKKKIIVKTSSSSLTDLQSCARLYKWNKIDRLIPTKKEKSLDYGGLFHYMIHPWRFGQIKQLKDHHRKHPYYRLNLLRQEEGQQALNNICRKIGELKSLTTDLAAEDRIRALEKFSDYTTHYLGLGWEFLEVEQPFAIKVYEDDDLIIILQGIVDTIADIPREGKTIVDSKTADRESYIPVTDNQLLGTAFAFNVKNFVVDKIYNRKDTPFVIDRYSFLTEQKQEWLDNTVYWIKQGLFFEQNNFYPHNPSSCRKWGKCRYMKICETPASAREFKLNTFFTKGSEPDIYRIDPLISEIISKLLGERHDKETTDGPHAQVSESKSA